jgi:hypothetical protein
MFDSRCRFLGELALVFTQRSSAPKFFDLVIAVAEDVA